MVSCCGAATPSRGSLPLPCLCALTHTGDGTFPCELSKDGRPGVPSHPPWPVHSACCRDTAASLAGRAPEGEMSVSGGRRGVATGQGPGA